MTHQYCKKLMAIELSSSSSVDKKTSSLSFLAFFVPPMVIFGPAERPLDEGTERDPLGPEDFLT